MRENLLGEMTTKIKFYLLKNRTSSYSKRKKRNERWNLMSARGEVDSRREWEEKGDFG